MEPLAIAVLIVATVVSIWYNDRIAVPEALKKGQKDPL